MSRMDEAPIPLRRGLFMLVICLGLVLATWGCKASRPTTPIPTGGIAVTVDVVPLIIPADTSSTATVWVTVLDSGIPVSDSTVVSMVATIGTVDSVAYTKDGLAVATYRGSKETGVASVIAQSLGARDTMNITLY